jgi:hypothetical protein
MDNVEQPAASTTESRARSREISNWAAVTQPNRPASPLMTEEEAVAVDQQRSKQWLADSAGAQARPKTEERSEAAPVTEFFVDWQLPSPMPR